MEHHLRGWISSWRVVSLAARSSDESSEIRPAKKKKKPLMVSKAVRQRQFQPGWQTGSREGDTFCVMLASSTGSQFVNFLSLFSSKLKKHRRTEVAVLRQEPGHCGVLGQQTGPGSLRLHSTDAGLLFISRRHLVQ